MITPIAELVSKADTEILRLNHAAVAVTSTCSTAPGPFA